MSAFVIDVQRVFVDIKTYHVDAHDIKEAEAISLGVARKDNWEWPSAPCFSVLYAEQEEARHE